MKLYLCLPIYNLIIIMPIVNYCNIKPIKLIELSKLNDVVCIVFYILLTFADFLAIVHECYIPVQI